LCMGNFLSPKEREELKDLHRYERERRYADRIKALLLWDDNWTLEQIAEVLLLDEKSVRRFRKLYEEEGSDGWILKGKEKQIPTNTGRKRLNLNGALNAETHQIIVRADQSINAQSTILLFTQLDKKDTDAKTIYVILDNARYYRSKSLSRSLWITFK